MGNAFSIMGNFLFALAAITFISFFFLKEPGLFKSIIISVVPTGYEERANNILSRTKTTLRSYSLALVGQITIIFTIVFTGLSLISLFGPGIVTLKMALLMAAFAGVINLIPYLGPILGYAFGLLMVLVTNLDIFGESDLFLLVGVVSLVYVIAQGIDNFFTQPILFSKSVQAHPLEIFLIIIISGNIAGIPGMILAVPVYSFIRIFLKEFFSEYKVVRRLTSKMD
jgi:predicted PurR-regulated permease PerM